MSEVPPENSEDGEGEGGNLIQTFTDETKRDCYNRMVSHLNSVSFGVLEYYPQAEIQSWPIQNPEANAVVAAGPEAGAEILDLAPFLTMVCSVHYQTEDPVELVA